MAVRIRNQFYSERGRYYRVEIHDSDYVGSVLTDFEDSGFEIDWSGESDNIIEPIKSSTCSFTLINDFSTDFNAFRNDLATAAEDEFKLVIYLWDGAAWDLYWCGVIMTDLVDWGNDTPNTDFVIQAKDGLNRLSEIEFTNINSSPFTTEPKTFMYIIEKCLAKNGLASFHSGDYIKVSIDWNDTQQSLAVPSRILENVRIWGDLLRKDQPEDSIKRNDYDAMTCRDVLSNLLQIFAARIIYSEGAYHIQQVSNFNADTYIESRYNSSGTYSANGSVTNKKSTGSDFIVASGGTFGYYAGLSKTKLTARGYLDVKGAYIDQLQVNRSDTTETTTLTLGTIIGGTYATATKTTTGSTNTFRAENAGTAGNSIALVFDGTKTAATVVNDWNSANTTNRVVITSGANSIVHAAGTTTLSGGAGASNRNLEFDFDLQNFSNDKVKSSNIKTVVDVKLICGSYRIKNRAGYTNQGVCDWSTTAADKWTYTKYGYDTNLSKIQLVTPEIPFEEEDNCTAEITITIIKIDASAWIDATNPNIWPQTNWDFYSSLRKFRVIAWDENNDTVSDIEVSVINPDTNKNSIEKDLGQWLIGDNQVVITGASSKNWLEIYSSLGTWKRSNVWDAGFTTDYNLIKTVLSEHMALQRVPISKYMGEFIGEYEAWKSIGYDSVRWAMQAVRYNAQSDTWSGTWSYMNYSQADIASFEERLRPPSIVPDRPPIKVLNNPSERIPIPINPKGKGAIPYEPGMGAINAIDTEALDNNNFRSGDSMLVYHPTTWEKLHEFVVDADTTISDTSISVVSDTPDGDIPVGAVLEHNSKEVVESETIRTVNLVNLGASWSKTVYLTESDFASSIYTLDGTEGITLVNISGGGSYYVDLPLVADAERNGCGLDLIVKHLAGSFEVRVPAGDSGVYIKTTQSSTSTSLAVTGGDSLRVVYDVTNGHWQKITI
jgi:hypothetical protein